MPVISLHAGPLHAEIAPRFGACLTDFSIDGPEGDRAPIMRRAPGGLDAFTRAACFLMAPWANRVAGSAFDFDGQTHRLRRTWSDGSAIHGDVATRPWRIIDRTPVSARMVFDSREHDDANFPFAFACVFRVELSPDWIRLDLSVTNTDRTPMPGGVGFHPYFMRRLFSEADAVEVRAPVAGRYPLEAGVPTGPAEPDDACERLSGGAPLGDAALDDCFAGFAGRAEITWPASGVKLTMDCSDALGHLVVFTPRHDASGAPLPWFCVEPVTMANDGFNLAARAVDAGVRRLDPGDTLHASVVMHVATP